MVEFDSFLDWCDQGYRSCFPCRCGVSCTNNNYCNGIAANCYDCIRRVHAIGNRLVHYNCSKMVLYYVLKHGYRFRAEIIVLLYRIREFLSQQKELYITSVGCGPCTELFGCIHIWRLLGKQDEFFHFRGFDTDSIWSPLMDQVQKLFPNADVKNNCQDALLFYSNTDERVDIIILNYMLSDMKKFNSSHFSSFLTNFVGLIRCKKTRYILINDIYLKESLSASYELISLLSKAGLVDKLSKYQYCSLNSYIGQHGPIVNDKPQFKLQSSSIVREYDPFQEINSIQTIIKIK